MASPADEVMVSGAPEISAEAKKAEVEHFEQVIKAFQFYSQHALSVIHKVNQQFLGTIVDHAKSFICTSQLLHDARTQFEAIHSEENLDMDKIRCTLRQFMRDWSEEGANERKQGMSGTEIAYARAGRLAYNVAKLGFSAQGCEFSYQMLISSNYILNYAPGGLPANVDFSMVAGDFLEVYRGQVGEWDCVATSFFIDTASNIHYGFEIQQEKECTCYYTQNPSSMMHTIYNCSFFVAIKKPSRIPFAEPNIPFAQREVA